MNKIQVGGFIRISKREAERRYNAGETIRFCGYVIGGLWLQLFEVQPVEKAV